MICISYQREKSNYLLPRQTTREELLGLLSSLLPRKSRVFELDFTLEENTHAHLYTHIQLLCQWIFKFWFPEFIDKCLDWHKGGWDFLCTLRCMYKSLSSLITSLSSPIPLPTLEAYRLLILMLNLQSKLSSYNEVKVYILTCVILAKWGGEMSCFPIFFFLMSVASWLISGPSITNIRCPFFWLIASISH